MAISEISPLRYGKLLAKIQPKVIGPKTGRFFSRVCRSVSLTWGCPTSSKRVFQQKKQRTDDRHNRDHPHDCDGTQLLRRRRANADGVMQSFDEAGEELHAGNLSLYSNAVRLQLL